MTKKLCVEIMRTNKITDVSDIIISFVSPLIYAQKNRPDFFYSFLMHLNKSHPEEYEKFIDLQKSFNELFEEQDSTITALYEEEIEVTNKRYQKILEDINLIESKYHKTNRTIKKINALIEEKHEIESEIRNYKKILYAKPRELETFLNIIAPLDKNWKDGIIKLDKYLLKKEYLCEFLEEHENEFENFTARFIVFTILNKPSLRNTPLPLYLCPFDKENPNFNPVITNPSITHFDIVIKKAGKVGAERLKSIINKTQLSIATHQGKNKQDSSKKRKLEQRTLPPSKSSFFTHTTKNGDPENLENRQRQGVKP